MRGAALLVMAGCNQFYDIRETRTHDARPIDAPFVCPTDRPLQFSTLLQLVHAQPCRQYSTAASANVAIATCFVSDRGELIFESAAGSALVESAGIQYPMFAGYELFHAPRLSPDGSRLYIRVDTRDENLQTVIATYYDAYTRTGSSWTQTTRLDFAQQPYDALSSIAPAPDGSERALLLRQNEIEEWAYSGSWTLIRPTRSLGMPVVTEVMLSRDGLVVVAVAGPPGEPLSVMWARRATLDDDFTALAPIPDLPVPKDHTIYFTENCGRAYLSGVAGVFFAQQQ